MKLEGSHEYPVPVDAVIAMLEDASATVEKYEGMGHRDVEIIELVPGDGRCGSCRLGSSTSSCRGSRRRRSSRRTR